MIYNMSHVGQAITLARISSCPVAILEDAESVAIVKGIRMEKVGFSERVQGKLMKIMVVVGAA